ncbi:MAG: beta-galactosidase [Lentisphaerae bacterium]|nr:beta-galactosidase [Lentisphaerota bacterium]
MNASQFNNVFPLGSHLCREPMPSMGELRRDMENLKKHGFNLIKLQEHWMIDEPAEGRYDFSRYEELIAQAARLDLGVYLGLTCEQAPAWLWRKHPECRMVGRNGFGIAYEAQTTLPGDGKPGPCYDHAGARADMVRFITRLVKTLGRYENIVVWNTWQEIGYWSVHFCGQEICYCPNTLAAFRAWLKELFSDLDALNRAWNTRYGDWVDVAPDRIIGKYPLAQNVAWQYFMDNVQIAKVLKARFEAIRAADSLRRPVFAHKGGPIIGSGQDWTYADAPHEALLGEMYSVARHYDYIRSCNRRGARVWAAEFQGGPVSTGFHKGRVPFAEDIRRWMLTAVGSGVSAISFWVTRAEIMAAETNGFSLLDSEGDTTPRFEEAARVGQALNRHAELFGRPSWPGAQVGLLINEWNYQFCQSMAQGGENLARSVSGWHRMLWEAGIPLDFVEVSELDETYLTEKKVLILPFPLSISEDVAQKLILYVKRGGTLISEAAPGRVNEWAFGNRGEISGAFAQLFGVRQESFAMVREPADGAIWSPPPRTWGEYLPATMLEGIGVLAGHRLRANIYIETFTVQGSEPCLMFGAQVAGVRRAVGKGTAILLGTYVGHNGTAYPDQATRSAVAALLRSADVAGNNVGRLLVRKRTGPSKDAWLFTNPTERPITETISVSGWKRVEDLLGEQLPRNGDCINLTVNSLDVRVLILTK